MNDATVRVLDVLLILGVLGLALSPWPWLSLLFVVGYYAVLLFLINRRTPPKVES